MQRVIRGHSRLGRLARAAAAFTASALCSASAPAIVYVLPTDASMVERSPTIVFGEVVAVRPAAGARLPSTDLTVAVEEVLKGEAPGGAVVVRQPGGVGPDGLGVRVHGLPQLGAGDRVLLFLAPDGEVYRTVEFGLGVFFEVERGDRVLLMREPSLRFVEPPPTGEQAREAGRFRGWINDRVGAVERPPDYFVAPPPQAPSRVAEPFRVTVTPESCERSGVPVRWREFDNGERVGMVVHEAGQDGVPGGGLSEVRVGMGAWNDDPESRVELFVERESSDEPRIQMSDRVNSITFEDPHDEIEGSYEVGEGGTIAITYVFFFCDENTRLHEIPGNRSVQALEIIEANMTTQDGYAEWVASRSNPAKSHEQVMGHELGHVIGISHPCGDSASGDCNADTGEALMRARVHADDRGAALADDDRAAVRYLYSSSDGVAPDPYPDPPTGPGYTDCRPSDVPLSFEGGFEVRMCYETPDGVIGEARSGVWASPEAGLLWFFSRENAEVLIKVLDGCAINGHRWVFAAPATDLAFNLHVRDSYGRYWSQHNPQGQTAATRSDTQAFRCE